MHEYASDWLERRRVGEIGEGPLNESTYQDYLWRLKKQVLPFFGPMPVARISDADCQRFRGKLFKDSDELKKIAAAGGRADDENGRQRRPLSPRSIQMMMRLLGQILAQAVRDKVREDNPPATPSSKSGSQSPHEPSLRSTSSSCCWTQRPSTDGAEVEQTRQAHARAGGGDPGSPGARETQYALRLEYGLSAGAMSMLAQGKTYTARNDRIGWRALCAMLGYAGPRIAETLDILERDVRLHDPNGARLWISDSKTPTGVRHVEITPSLRDELLAYRADKVRHGYPTGPDAPFFCTRNGKRWNAATSANASSSRPSSSPTSA